MNRFLFLCCFCLFYACQSTPPVEVDLVLLNGTLYDGTDRSPITGDIAIRGDSIAWVGPSGSQAFTAAKEIDASGLIISPGFIDPHTHATGDLLDSTRNANLAFLMQGVTTVMIGSDGGGPLDIAATIRTFEEQGIGTHVGLLTGHGTIRRAVMGLSADAPNDTQLQEMKDWVQKGMEAGALGLSTGLYYSPGSYAKTEEVIELAKVAAEHGGYYDSHLRDESTYNIGLLNAVREVIRISHEAKLPGHIAHIKCLGVDVWDQSKDVIALVDSARKAGLEITADQYPYRASGTSLSACLVPRWVMQDSRKAFESRLQAPSLLPKIKTEMTENLRRRGGAASLLVTGSSDTSLLGKTLEELAQERNLPAIETAIQLVLAGRVGVASFNMKEEDVIRYMQQPWVMTGSDGSFGHPRKYGSFPQKYREFVKEKEVISLQQFIHRSTGLTAESLGISDRGVLQTGAMADIIVFDPDSFQDQSTFTLPTELATGLRYAFLNGNMVVEQGEFLGELAGRVIRK